MYKPLAFLKRDLLQELTYKLSFLLQMASIFFSLAMFYFISKLVSPAASPYLAKYGGDYFPFILIGLAFYQFLGTSLGSFSSALRGGQMMGTLEVMFLTPTNPYMIIISSSLFSYIYTSIELTVYLIFGALFFGFDIFAVNWPAFLLVFALTIIAFSSLGIISASFILVFKRGDPIAFLIHSLSGLFGGVFYPIEVLPDWLKIFPKVLPITYSLEAFRACIMKGSGIAEISHELLALVIFTCVTLPPALLSFKLALAKAKRDGSLSGY